MNTRREFLDFHVPSIGEDEIKEVVETLRSGWLTTGAKAKRFEEEFAEYVGAKHAIAVNSGTAALHLALDAIGLERGDEVIVPTTTFAATAEVVIYFNARPVLVDIDPRTLNIDPVKLETKVEELKAKGSKLKAIIPVHFGGLPCDMDKILDIARRYDLKVIEDAAHSLPAYYRSQKSEVRGQEGTEVGGQMSEVRSQKSEVRGQSGNGQRTEDRGQRSEVRGQMVGSIGDITCFSFYVTKPLTTGEGGMITTENDEYAEKVRTMSLHGISKDAWNRYTSEGSWYYEILYPGYKYNLTDIAASLGIHQLKKCDEFWHRRKEIAHRYTEAFSNLEEIMTPYSLLPASYSLAGHAWHLYVILIKPERLKIDRGRFIKELKKRNVGASVHFIPLHLHPYYRNNYGYKKGDFPDAEWVYERSISLPIYPKMSDEDVEYVIEAVRDVLGRR